MNALRNVSSQSLILQKPGGGTMHLLPGRAITLSAEELQTPQVLNILKSGLAQVDTLNEPAPAPQPAVERRRSSEPAPKAPGPK
jgi:hypothetical protein